MQIQGYGKTHVGHVRSANEDFFECDNERKLYIVADGMGGHQGGAYASRHAVEKIKEILQNQESDQNSTRPIVAGGEITPTQIRLKKALVVANEHLYLKSQQEPTLRGMGTTCTAVQFDEQNVNIAHVGDSRLYLLRGGKFRQITKDHSWVQEQVDSGVLTEAEANEHPLKNIITRSLGHDRDLEVDLLKEPFQGGDKFLICSDGLTNMVPDDTIRSVITEKPPPAALEELILLALERGGLDNITAIIVDICE